MAEVDRILIVGGGIAGLSLATALHRQGYTPELARKQVRSGLAAGGRGIRTLGPPYEGSVLLKRDSGFSRLPPLIPRPLPLSRERPTSFEDRRCFGAGPRHFR
jgi:NADPH-dependent 2,4-dienoyl-CoA reductase/sulfur reductase-like enzyme